MRLLLATAVVLFAGSALDRAQADPYPWCAVYGDHMGGSTNCYMRTLEECRVAISGNGGFCSHNPFYDGRPVVTDGSAVETGRSSRRHKKHDG